MATQIQRRRGTTAQHSTFTGALGELTVDTDKKTVVVHDGITAGGFPLAGASTYGGIRGRNTDRQAVDARPAAGRRARPVRAGSRVFAGHHAARANRLADPCVGRVARLSVSEGLARSRLTNSPPRRILFDQVFDRLVGVERVAGVVNARRRRRIEPDNLHRQAGIGHSSRRFVRTAGTHGKRHKNRDREQLRESRWFSRHFR